MKTCPVCHQPNQCTGDSRCWCMDVRIPPKNLQKIDERDKNQRCLCPKCALTSDAAQPKPR